jgi:formylglycine-generating enzyme
MAELSLPAPIPVRTFLEMTQKIRTFQNKMPSFPATFSLPFPAKMKMEESWEDEGEGGGEERQQNIAWVPEGPAIIGDPFLEGRDDETPTQMVELAGFLIAATTVTNSQFAMWLNQLLIHERIKIVKKGHIVDLTGTLLARTTEVEPLSQVQVSAALTGKLRFKPVSGKENHPVVHVTYDGADLFCADNGGRLPNEEEWEKAAGMHSSASAPLKKFRFGFSEDVIDISMANYAEGYSDDLRKMNLTQPVGFYNGTTVFIKAGRSVKSKNAISPYGCYDMSGNVREWVSNWYGDEQTHKTTKGGSYDSPAFDLRVAAKTSLYLDSCDPYTGFRIAFDL